MSLLVGLPSRPAQGFGDTRPHKPDAGPQKRFQKLCPHPNGPSREQVAAHQRERLWRAMVQAVAWRGYDAATVGQVCELAGVSKRAFYELFTGKPGCFAFAYEQVVRRAVERVAIAARGRRDGRESLRAALGALMEGIAHDPGAARFVLVHALDATPDAFERREWAVGLLEQALARCLGAGERIPVVLRGIAAGAVAVARARVLEDRSGELAGVVDELADWAWRCARQGPAAARNAQMGMVPHLRTVAPAGWCERGAELDGRVRDERALLRESALALAARGGMLTLTPDALTAASGVTARRMYALFESVDQCLLEALEQAGEDLVAGAVRAGAAARRWPQGVRLAVAALLRALAEDRALARVAFVESLALGPRAVALRESLCASFAGGLSQSAPAEWRPGAIACEASVGAVWAIIERHVAKGGTARLPRLEPACVLLLGPLTRGWRTCETGHDEGGLGVSLAPTMSMA